MTKTSPSPANKVKPVLKTCPKIWRILKNTFTTLQANIVDLKEEESDLSDSDGESHADSLLFLKYNY